MDKKIIHNRYNIVKVIGSGAMSTVYLAEDNKTGAKAAIKELKFPGTENVANSEAGLRFKREAEVVSRLSHSGIIKIFDLVQEDNNLYLIMEYIEGNDLNYYIDKIDIKDKVRIMSSCASALAYIHSKDIVHRDIKPGNIIVFKNDGYQIKLIDFGLAYLRNFSDIFKEGSIVGSLAYIAPEQIGLLRRSIDNRSDLYSLGATFYELLAGKAPFPEIEIGKLIHRHLAAIPPRPSSLNPDIPPILDEIVLKLLNKEPDDRYQSAAGLKSDLDFFLSSPDKQYFTLALKDKIEKLNYQIKTVGRDAEISALLNAYHEAKNGNPHTVLITGQSGIGKTKLFEDVREELSGEQNLIPISYYCTQDTKNIPFAPIQSILKEYLEKYFNHDISDDIMRRAEEEIPLLLKVFPFLAEYFKSTPVEEISASFNNREVFFSIYRFLTIISQLNETIILFIDDLDYADSASKDFFAYMAKNMKMRSKILLIITIRDEALDTYFYSDIQSNSQSFSLLQIRPLQKSSLYLFVNRVFSFERIYRQEFYDFLYDKTNGIPIYLLELIKLLHAEKIIYSVDAGWEINYEQLNEFIFEKDIHTIFINKFINFEKEERAILSNASVLGNEFSLDDLNELIFRQNNVRNMDKIIHVIDKAYQENIVERDFTKKQSIYYFSNNNTAETIYHGIEPEYKKKLHRIIAEILEERSSDSSQNTVYRIAYHYNLSNNIVKQIEYNEKAYQAALSNFSLNETTYYMEKLIKQKMLHSAKSPELIALIKQFCRYLMLTGRIADSIQYLKIALQYSIDNNEYKNIVDVYVEIGSAYYFLQQQNEAFSCFNAAMSTAEAHHLNITDGIPYLLIGSALLFNYKLSEAENHLTKAIEYIDKTDYNALLTGYGLRSWIYTFKGEFDKVKLDIDFIEKHIQYVTDELVITKLFNYMAFYYMYSGEDINAALQYNSTARELALKSNNYVYQFGALISQMGIYTFLGDYETGLLTAEKAVLISREKKIFVGIENAWSSIAFLHIYNRNFALANEICDEHLKNTQIFINDKYSAIMFLFIKSIYYYYVNNKNKCLEYLEKTIELYESSEITLYEPFILNIQVLIYKDYGSHDRVEELERKISELKIKKPYMKFIFSRIDILIETIEEERKKRVEIDNRKTEIQHVSTSNIHYKEKLQLENIVKTSQKISSILDIDQLLDVIIDKTLEVTGAERAALLLINNVTGKLEYKITKASIIETNKEFKVPNSVIQEVEATKKGIVVSISDSKDYLPTDSIISQDIKSIICSPLIFEDKMIGLLYLDSKLLKQLFSEQDLSLLEVFASQAAISLVNAEKNSIIKKQFSDSAQIIYSLMSNNSSRVYENTQEVTHISVLLAKELGLKYGEVEQVRVAAILRDVGAINLMDKFLYSQNALKSIEKEIFTKHPLKSVEVIAHLQGIDEIKTMIMQHQERWDGSGYPYGLQGNNISLGARIIGLVDDFVLMLQQRVYQTPDKKEKIIEEIKSQSGILYDTRIAYTLIELINRENLIYTINEADIKYKKINSGSEWIIPSNLHFETIVVDRIMKEINSHVKINSDLSFSIDYSLCEVVRNAIIHGNKYNEEKSVSIRVKIIDMDIFAKKLTVVVSDEGEGMNVAEHDRFTESRNQIIYILNRLKNYKVSHDFLVNDAELESIVSDLTGFKQSYYTDFNIFRDIDGFGEASGGLGLIQVKNTFDKVEFNNIIKDNRISGLSVIMEKFIS